MQQVLSVLNKQQDKAKKLILESYQAHESGPPPKLKSGWSQDELNQALEESIQIQALKYNPNPMLGISPLYRQRIIHDLDIVLFMYYDIPNNDLDQLDLPISPYSKYYTKFAPLHLNDDPHFLIRTEREWLNNFYTKNDLPQKEVWSRKRITKISGCARKVLTNFNMNCVLFRYYILQNKPTSYTISDADFPAVNPNDILTIDAHFWNNQDNDLSMGGYHASLGFLKDYVVEFCRCDYELAYLFGTKKYLAKINFVLPEVELLAKGPIDEHVLGYVYKQQKSNKKDFFRFFDKLLVPTKFLQKFISRASHFEAP